MSLLVHAAHAINSALVVIGLAMAAVCVSGICTYVMKNIMFGVYCILKKIISILCL